MAGKSMLAEMYVTLSAVTDPLMAGFEEASEAGEEFAALVEGLQEKVDGLTEAFASITEAGSDLAETFAAGGDGAQEMAGELAGLGSGAEEGASGLSGLVTALTELGTTGTEAGAGADEAATGVEALATASAGGATDLGALAAELEGLDASLTETAATADKTAVSVAAAGDSAAEAGEKAGLASKDGILNLGGAFEKLHGFAELALVAVAAETVHMASDFQSAMETLHTQAGVAQSQIAGLSNGVLDLAGQVGFSPDSLAEALYHIESSFASVGITGPKALNLLQIAAEGAATGHADLVDVTNALDAAIASGIPGVQNFGQAMGVLNATVGAGDMTMQDLAGAFSTGLLANVKSYGLSITDVGAALATFGDNNIRGQNAATELRMAVQAMAVPAATAASQLDKMGMSTTTLANVMSKQGLLPALELLKTKMTEAGVTAQNQGEVLTQLFGKKAGAGIVVLYDQLSRLQSKYPDLTKGADNFAGAWQSTKQTVTQQLKDIRSGVESVGIKIGDYLLPQVSKLLGLITGPGATAFSKFASGFSKDFSQFTSGFTGSAIKVPVKLAPVANASPSIMAAERSSLASAAASPPPLTTWQQVGQAVKQIAGDFATFGTDASKAIGELAKALGPTAGMLAGAFLAGMKTLGSILANQVGPALVKLGDFFDKHKQVIEDFAKGALALLLVKLTAIGTVKAATGLVSMASSILGFPKKQLDSITGAFGNLKTAWLGKADGDGNMVGGLKNTLTSMWSTLSSATSTALGWGKSIVGGIGKGISGAGGAIGGAFKKIMPTKLDFKLMLQSVKDTGGKVATTISGWGGSIASTAKTAFSGIGNAAGTVLSNAKTWGSNVASSIGSGLSSAASGITTFASNVGTAAASLASSAWTGATQMLSGIAGSIGEAATATWGWVTSAAAATVEAAGEAIAWTADKVALVGSTIAEGAMTAAQWLLDAAMIANPIGLIVIAIVALIGVFVLLWTKCAWFRDLWKGLWSDIRKLAVAAWQGFDSSVIHPVEDFFTKTLPGVLTGAKHVWDDVWSGIKTTADQVWHWIDSNIVDPVKNVFTNDIPSALHTGKQTWDSVWNGIKTTASSVWHWIDGNVVQPVEKFFNTDLGGALTTAKNDWDKIWGGLQTTLSSIWNNDIKPILDDITSAVSTITSGISTVTGAAGKIGGGIGNLLSHLPHLDSGGFIPGGKGQPMLAVVHGGEYMLSNAMQDGSQPIDDRVMTDVLATRGGGGGGGSSAGALAVGQGGGVGTTVYQTIVNLQVAGSVTAENDLVNTVRTAVLQYQQRNSANGLTFAGG